LLALRCVLDRAVAFPSIQPTRPLFRCLPLSIPFLCSHCFLSPLRFTRWFCVCAAALKAVFPKGIDVYFDNTGGVVTDAAFDLINANARIGICGQVTLTARSNKHSKPHEQRRTNEHFDGMASRAYRDTHSFSLLPSFAVFALTHDVFLSGLCRFFACCLPPRLPPTMIVYTHTTALSQSTRPRRVAADAANIKIYLDDYSW
jgi:hypothetical protein